MVDVVTSNLQIQQLWTSLKKSTIHRVIEKMRTKYRREVGDSYIVLPQFLRTYSDVNPEAVVALQVDNEEKNDGVHGVDMDAIRKIMAEFFLQEAPPGIDADETIMLSNKLEFSRRHLSRLCLNSKIVATMDRPVCDKFWLTDELVNAYMGYCREQDYENTTFHNSTFWKLMVKVDSQVDEYDIEKAWTYAKRFHPDHPKGEFKQAGLHFFPKCNDVHWYLIIVDFDQKIIFSVDSYGDVDHEKDAKVMLTFFRLALLKKRAATWHSSRRESFMLQGNFKAMDWGYRQLPVPLACRQTDSISCGLFLCMNMKEIVQEQEILLVAGGKKLRRSQVSQEKAPLWRIFLFYIIVMKLK